MERQQKWLADYASFELQKEQIIHYDILKLLQIYNEMLYLKQNTQTAQIENYVK